MPVSAIVSEDVLLTLIWQVSALLAGLSISILFVLITTRLFASKQEARMALRYKELSKYFYAALSSPIDPTPESVPVLTGEDRIVVCRIALDILRTLKGDDATRIVKLLKVWDIQPYLFKMLKSGRRGIRIQALSLLAVFRTDESLHALLAGCEDKDPYVQIAALRGLSSWHDAAHITQVIQSLAKADTVNKLMLADVLKRFGDTAVPALISLASAEAATPVRLAALMALGSIRPLAAVDTLMNLLEDADENIRAQAASALGKIGDVRAGHALIKKLNDVSVGVRVQSTYALGSLNIDYSLPALTEMLNDPNWWVRFRAAESLHRLGDKGKALLRAMCNRHDAAGAISAQVLAERNDS